MNHFTAKELKKRNITLVDNSLASVCTSIIMVKNAAKFICCFFIQVTLTLWGKDAENFKYTGHPIVYIASAKTCEFAGVNTIKITNCSIMKINPDCDFALRLRS